jgi:lysozyme
MSVFDIIAPRLRDEEGTGPIKDGRQLVYRDSEGVWTIGYGRNVQDRGLSSEESEFLLENDVAECVVDLAMTLPFWSQLNEVRQAVLVDLYFNMRLGDPVGFARGFAPTLSLIAGGHYTEAGEHMKNWKWYTDVGPRRADPLIAMMQSGTIATRRASARTLQRGRRGDHGDQRQHVVRRHLLRQEVDQAGGGQRQGAGASARKTGRRSPTRAASSSK